MPLRYEIALVLSIVMWAVILGIIVSTKLGERRARLWEHPAQGTGGKEIEKSRLEHHV